MARAWPAFPSIQVGEERDSEKRKVDILGSAVTRVTDLWIVWNGCGVAVDIATELC